MSGPPIHQPGRISGPLAPGFRTVGRPTRPIFRLSDEHSTPSSEPPGPIGVTEKSGWILCGIVAGAMLDFAITRD